MSKPCQEVVNKSKQCQNVVNMSKHCQDVVNMSKQCQEVVTMHFGCYKNWRIMVGPFNFLLSLKIDVLKFYRGPLEFKLSQVTCLYEKLKSILIGITSHPSSFCTLLNKRAWGGGGGDNWVTCWTIMAILSLLIVIFRWRKTIWENTADVQGTSPTPCRQGIWRKL